MQALYQCSPMGGDEVLIQPDMLLGGRAVRYEALSWASSLNHGHPGDAGTERHICRHIPAKSSAAWVRNDVTMQQLQYECA